MDQGVVDNPVTLVIRAPNQKYNDQTINCYQNWTVEKLKAHLSDVYPSKPVSTLAHICAATVSFNLFRPSFSFIEGRYSLYVGASKCWTSQMIMNPQKKTIITQGLSFPLQRQELSCSSHCC